MTQKDYFDTSSVERVVSDVLSCGSNAAIVIKSTVPVGYTRELIAKIGYEKSYFHRNFYGKAEHYTTISIQAGLS